MKSHISEVVDLAIDMLEDRMVTEGRHILKTKSVRAFIENHIDADPQTEDEKILYATGLSQVIEQRLFKRGYRSVRKGRFSNLDECEDVLYLQEMLKNALENSGTKDDSVQRIRAKLDGQMKMIPDSDGTLNIIDTMTEEEFVARLEADAV